MSRQMLVYASEIEDGLRDKLANNKVVATLCPLFADNKLPESTRTRLEGLQSAFAGEENDQIDLYRLYTILVTVGWNLNDDVFDLREVWAARHSPEDKPFNLEHNPRQVIGHITGSVVVDDNYEVIADDTAVDKLPSKFHILTSAVIYKNLKCRDEKLTKETEELLASVAKGEKYVSMEALFTDFDYAVTTASGEQHILARTDETAWLTKHLRVYGGQGEVKGNKIGRAIKNITFSGKGLVARPANPESYIFNDVELFKGAFASKNLNLFDKNDTAVTTASTGEITMPDETVSKADFAAAQNEIKQLRERLEAAQEVTVKAKIEELTKTLASRDEEVKSLKTEVENVKASKKEVETAVEAAKAEVVEVKTKLTAAEAKLEETRIETIKANRIATLVEKGVEKSEAETVVTKFASASDEMFEVVVATQAQLVEAKKLADAAAAAKPTEKTEEQKKAEAAAQAAAAAKAIADAKPNEPEATLATQSDPELEGTVAGLADFLGQEIATRKKTAR